MSEVPFFYTNVLKIAMSQNDITIDFGYKPPAQPGEPTSEAFDVVARVSMSPSHGKHMLLILKGLVDGYETKIGQIPLEPDKLEAYNALFNK